MYQLDENGWPMGDYRTEPPPPDGKLIWLDTSEELTAVSFNVGSGEWESYLKDDAGNYLIDSITQNVKVSSHKGKVRFIPTEDHDRMSIVITQACKDKTGNMPCPFCNTGHINHYFDKMGGGCDVNGCTSRWIQ